MFEHPVGSMSLGTQLVKKLYTLGGGDRVNFDLCCFGMKSSDHDGEGFVKKRTSVVSNSEMLIKAPGTHNCAGGHRHVHLLNGKASACQQYPEEFCDLCAERS